MTISQMKKVIKLVDGLEGEIRLLYIKCKDYGQFEKQLSILMSKNHDKIRDVIAEK